MRPCSFSKDVLNGFKKPLYASSSFQGAVPTSQANLAIPLPAPTSSPPNLPAFFTAVEATSPILFHTLTDYPLIL